jgi:hypothetical protein
MAELDLEEPGEISHTSAEPFIRPDQVGVTVIQGRNLSLTSSSLLKKIFRVGP